MIITFREDHDVNKKFLKQMKIEKQRVEKIVKIARKTQVDNKQIKLKTYRFREKIMNFQVELNIVIEILIEHRDAKTIRKVDLIETIDFFDSHRRLVTRDEQLLNFRVFFSSTIVTTFAQKSDKHFDSKKFIENLNDFF